jgi:hypothetical protein
MCSADKARLSAELEAEAEQLRMSGLALPLQPLPLEGPSERLPFSDARLAAHVAAQTLPLGQLVAALLPVFRVPDGEAAVEGAVLRR